ncbi:MAG TPA: hypothetical protein VHZ25_17750 [Acidobacteriaceae bacterium]|jgi:hypothetical protein|nr:hypothetical protein [Acidobacteriaceae bacterium]
MMAIRGYVVVVKTWGVCGGIPPRIMSVTDSTAISVERHRFSQLKAKLAELSGGAIFRNKSIVKGRNI